MMNAAPLFSDEDHHLSTDHQLETPLAVYRLKPVYLRLYRGSSLLSYILSVLGVATIVGLVVQNVDQIDQPGHALEFLFVTGTPLVLSVGALLGGVVARNELQRRIILCEGGLLQVWRPLKRQRVEVVRWQEIASIRRAWIGEAFAYAIAYGAGEPRRQLTLTGGYQHLDELVTPIAHHSGAALVEQGKREA